MHNIENTLLQAVLEEKDGFIAEMAFQDKNSVKENSVMI
jgi:hypothetical protein